jgi:hypothetical protein
MPMEVGNATSDTFRVRELFEDYFSLEMDVFRGKKREWMNEWWRIAKGSDELGARCVILWIRYL